MLSPGEGGSDRLAEEHAGLSQEEFECADQMIKMSRQYLGLVAKKLRYELPKMIFSDLLCSASTLENRLKAVLRPPTSSILELMTAEQPESKEQRLAIEARMRCLDRISSLLKSSDFFSLVTEAEQPHEDHQLFTDASLCPAVEAGDLN